ncbi:MAG: tetratricopeptide repeat protein [Actinomycetaceae bacterium]|nr:tetratricopeptide repeat protein [Actinomycetaceae bacterium]
MSMTPEQPREAGQTRDTGQPRMQPREPQIPSAHEAVDLSHAASQQSAHSQDGLLSHTPGGANEQPTGGQGAIAAPLVRDLGDENDFREAVELSRSVPIVVQFWAEWCGPCRQLKPIMQALAAEYGGRFQLAQVDIDKAQTLAQAFQVQSVPAVFAIVGGQPLPLFQGALPKAQVKHYLDQLMQAAEQAGVVGRISGDAAPKEPTKEELAIEAAIEAGDFDEAERLLAVELENNPGSSDIKAALSQVRLQKRLIEEQREAEEKGSMNDSDPLVLADQFMAAGNSPAAYQILLDVIAQAHGENGDDTREAARKRIIELFSIDAHTDAVSVARRKLSEILFS